MYNRTSSQIPQASNKHQKLSVEISAIFRHLYVYVDIHKLKKFRTIKAKIAEIYISYLNKENPQRELRKSLSIDSICMSVFTVLYCSSD